MARDQYSLKLALLLVLALQFSAISIHALNIGIQTAGSGISVNRQCSRKCESEFCAVPPFLRYGKYCGFSYGGCPGEKPCDGLDACCMTHDNCVQAKNNYLSEECSQNLINCMANFKNSGRQTFEGNKCNVREVIDELTIVMDAAILAGRLLHRP
ncbi:hypothetical protein HHK36_013488 [Tetracentron sinense]|uniref:phospholipase A2 n=1 Tax=Tetracentron sinense TaxID=13715 RepID=A0A834ZDL9_TETSI|nr:hypothetical protein HHK36_013488 [Tetracentron sinense]